MSDSKPDSEPDKLLQSQDGQTDRWVEGHKILQPDAAEVNAAEAQRTNASTGSLQDRRRLINEQNSSLEVSGEGRVASRHSKLRESDLSLQISQVEVIPQSHKANEGVSISSPDLDGRPIYAYRPEQTSSHTYSLGLAYEERLPPQSKLGVFLASAAARAMSRDQQRAFIQGELDKVIGIGEGLNFAKEQTKAATVAAWTAFEDGTVADFLAQPNAINDPVCRAAGRICDALANDPSMLSKVFVHVGEHLLRCNDKYNEMSDLEKGRFIGEVMFSMFNFESESVGTVNEELIESTAGKSEKISGDLQSTYDEHTLSGAGGDWPRINERASPHVVKQCHPNACVSACGEMLTNGAIKQETLVEAFKRYLLPSMLDKYPTADLKWLPQELGGDWRYFEAVDHNPATDLENLLKQGDKWATEFRSPGRRGHIVIVDGENKAGELIIRDPQDGTTYEMTKPDFYRYWTGRVVSRKK